MEFCEQCKRGPFPDVPAHAVNLTTDDYIFHIYAPYPHYRALCTKCYTRWRHTMAAFARAEKATA